MFWRKAEQPVAPPQITVEMEPAPAPKRGVLAQAVDANQRRRTEAARKETQCCTVENRLYIGWGSVLVALLLDPISIYLLAISNWPAFGVVRLPACSRCALRTLREPTPRRRAQVFTLDNIASVVAMACLFGPRRRRCMRS